MEMNDKYADANNRKSLGQLILGYLPYWPLFTIVLAISLLCAWIYLHYISTPLYEASATVLIKDEKKGAEDAKSVEDLNFLSSKKIIENEIEVFQSRTLLNDVVRNLHLDASVYQRHRFKD